MSEWQCEVAKMHAHLSQRLYCSMVWDPAYLSWMLNILWTHHRNTTTGYNDCAVHSCWNSWSWKRSWRFSRHRYHQDILQLPKWDTGLFSASVCLDMFLCNSFHESGCKAFAWQVWLLKINTACNLGRCRLICWEVSHLTISNRNVIANQKFWALRDLGQNPGGLPITSALWTDLLKQCLNSRMQKCISMSW